MADSNVDGGDSTYASQDSQTAQEYIAAQLQLEADAREAMPYEFNSCTYSLGPLKQRVFSCLTCNPPPANASDPYTPAGVCYACSISCHGEHELVECWSRRNFVCDCGTKRVPSESPCKLRRDDTTGAQGGRHSEEPAVTNTYNHNFRNRFCGCGDLYDPFKQKGSMFQCIGLATEAEGGCGEDWWHPECIMGLDKNWQTSLGHDADSKSEDKTSEDAPTKQEPGIDNVPDGSESAEVAAPVEPLPLDVNTDLTEPTVAAENDGEDSENEGEVFPPGFPRLSSFDRFICYKCTSQHPWIKRYAGANGFLQGVVHEDKTSGPVLPGEPPHTQQENSLPVETSTKEGGDSTSENRKRKRTEDDNEESTTLPPPKEAKPDDTSTSTFTSTSAPSCLWAQLREATPSPISLFVKEDFRQHLCRCPSCFPLLAAHPQLLEEEDEYSPPLSEGSDADANGAGDGTNSVGSRSLLERGEAALSNMDRVRAIEGVMAYNHMRDKLKAFLKPFAEDGKPVGAEDIKLAFAQMRGDDLAMREAKAKRDGEQGDGGGDGEADARREQSGY